MKSHIVDFLTYIKKSNFFPSKNLGQNFLISDFYVKKITNLIVDKNDFIIEIGPGLGSLTYELVKNCNNLLVIEFDKRLIGYLREKFTNLNLVSIDVLKFDFNLEFKNRKWPKSLIISNLPYSISSQIIFMFIYFDNIKEMIFMVQKEMAERLIIGKKKKHNSFSILLNLIFLIKQEFNVPSSVFFPQPKVISTVLHFYRKKINFDISEMNEFLKLCFSQKRKTINNNLKEIYSEDKINNIFAKLSYDKSSRPSDFSLDNYLSLYNEFYEKI